MPRYVIERQYLVPMFEHILVEAPNFDAACGEAIDEFAQPWGDHVKPDFDNARAITITLAVEIPENLFPELRSREDEDRHILSQVLYDAGLDPLAIPPAFAERCAQGDEPVGFA
ncbi:MAG TPA: hypothetical protein VGS13_01460 [Stellaceae bacterium]|nr:hypothetical protein [Stellaceae bacterium]